MQNYLLPLIIFALAGLLVTRQNLVALKKEGLTILSFFFLWFIAPVSTLIALIQSCLIFFLAKGRNKAITDVLIIFTIVIYFAAIYFFQFHLHNNSIQLIGYSFLVLQLIAYLIQIKYTANNLSFQNFLFAVFYFPKYINGPFIDPVTLNQQEIPSQIKITKSIIFRLFLGLFKLLVLGSNLNYNCHSVLDYMNQYSWLTNISAMIFYTIALYINFSGASDLAITIAKLQGITLPENFNLPLWSNGPKQFWKRWHMSLTNWLMQFIFFPVYYKFAKAGNQFTGKITGVLLVFLCMALFNGILPGFFLSALIFFLMWITEEFLSEHVKLPAPIKIILNFLGISVALLLFRNASNPTQTILTLVNPIRNELINKWYWAPLAGGGTQHDYFNLFLTFILTLGFLLFEKRIHFQIQTNNISNILLYVIIILTLIFGNYFDNSPFSYIQVK